jgi:hypothetical protein
VDQCFTLVFFTFQVQDAFNFGGGIDCIGAPTLTVGGDEFYFAWDGIHFIEME